MSATIRLGKVEATIDGYVWTSADPIVADFLNSRLDPLGPSGSDPNPDHTAALQAVRELHGELLRFDAGPDEPGRVY